MGDGIEQNMQVPGENYRRNDELFMETSYYSHQTWTKSENTFRKDGKIWAAFLFYNEHQPK